MRGKVTLPRWWNAGLAVLHHRGSQENTGQRKTFLTQQPVWRALGISRRRKDENDISVPLCVASREVLVHVDQLDGVSGIWDTSINSPPPNPRGYELRVLVPALWCLSIVESDCAGLCRLGGRRRRRRR